MKYTVADKLAGRDLHGLSCRVPKPTKEQSECSHTKFKEIDDGYEDWDGDWHSEFKTVEVCLMDDIPGTNNIRCSRCGYTRRY
jgi:hypothetical protein